MNQTAFQIYAFQHDAFQIYSGGGSAGTSRGKPKARPKREEPGAPLPVEPPPQWFFEPPPTVPFVQPQVPAVDPAAVAQLEQQAREAQDMADIQAILNALP